LGTASGFGKAYLNLLVDEVRLDGSELRIKGSCSAFARAVTLSKVGEVERGLQLHPRLTSPRG